MSSNSLDVVFRQKYRKFVDLWVAPLEKECLIHPKPFFNIIRGLQKIPDDETSAYAMTFVETFLKFTEGISDIKGALYQFLGPLTEEEEVFIERDEFWTKTLEGWMRVFTIMFGYSTK
jgi:hypothetical protein